MRKGLEGSFWNGVHSFLGRFDICTSVKSELLGLLNGLKLAWVRGSLWFRWTQRLLLSKFGPKFAMVNLTSF